MFDIGITDDNGWYLRGIVAPMLLVPCTTCRRHIAEDAPACPFCASAQAPAPPRALYVRTGRFSRAAVFAGLAACYTSTSPPPAPPEPPPPSDTGPQSPRSGNAGLHGRLTHARTGAPLAGVTVEVWTSVNVPTTATTEADGTYAVQGIPPGEYQISFIGPDGTRYAAGRIIKVRTPDETLNLAIDPEPMPEPMPYGAPPARRRVV